MQKLLDFLSQLESKKIYYTLTKIREEAIMVQVTVPGQRWEIEFFSDGEIEVEVFSKSSGVQGEDLLKQLFDRYSD